MTPEFEKWFKEKAKEGDLHYKTGLADGYAKAMDDMRLEIFSKPISVGDATVTLGLLGQEANRFRDEALVQKRECASPM